MALDVIRDAPYHDAMAEFHDASKLTPARLGPSTPLGFFRSLDPHSNATAFWIVEREGVKSAIILKAADPKWIFDTVSLAHADETAWSGVSLGPVEVLVDLTSGQFVEEPRFGRGAITITGGKIIISAVPSGRLGSRVSFEVGDAGTPAGQVAGIFGRWQLVQRDHTGRPVVLFELD